MHHIELKTAVNIGYPSDHPDYESSQWIFIQDLKVVGVIDADCFVCAWRDGHLKFPNALMAWMAVPVEEDRSCVWWNVKGAYI